MTGLILSIRAKLLFNELSLGTQILLLREAEAAEDPTELKANVHVPSKL